MTTVPLFTNWLTGQPLDIAATPSFLANGTGAVVRTWGSKASDILNVFDFMTTAQIADVQARTMTLDVSGAMQSAINSVGANGGKLICPNGQYLINTTVTAAKNAIDLEGEFGTTWFVNGQTNAPCLTIGDGITTYNRGSIRNIVFSQKSGVTPVSGNIGLNAKQLANWRFENVEVHQFPSALNQGIVFNNISQSVFRAIGVQNCLADGITLSGNVLDAFCSQIRSDANGGSGFVIAGCQGIYMLNCSGFNNSNNAFQFTPGNPQVNANMFFVSCIGDTSKSYNWNIPELLDSTFINCWGSTQQSAAVNPTAAGFILYNTNVKNIRFIGCQAQNNNGSGFALFNNGAGLPSGIMFDACQSGSTANGANGNGKGGSGWGYDLGNANNVSVIGGKVQGNATAPFNNITGTGCRIRDVDGYNPVGSNAAVTMGASPFTYTAGPSPETHYINQSATNTATIAQGGNQIAALVNASTYYQVHLEPTESYVTTWATTAPTYTKMVH